MKFQVELTLPFHQVLRCVLEMREELVASGELHLRTPFKVLEPLKSLNMFNLGSATSISISEEKQGGI